MISKQTSLRIPLEGLAEEGTNMDELPVCAD